MHVCVLIPCYREYENLKRLIPLLYREVYPQLPNVRFSTLVVDDNSKDGTEQLMELFQKKYKSLFVSYGEKKGIGRAMKRGFGFALAKLHSDVVATLEADFVVDPVELVAMIKLLSEYDVVLASRKNEEEYYGKWTVRRLMHVVVNDVICRLIGGMDQVHEHTAACRVIKVKGVLEEVDLDSLPNGYAFFGVILFRISKLTKSFWEHRVVFFERTEGQTKMNLRKIKPMLRELVDYVKGAVKNRLTSRPW